MASENEIMGQINFRTRCPHCDIELSELLSKVSVSEVAKGFICGSCGETIYIFLSWFGVARIGEKEYTPAFTDNRK